jgi:phosphoribosylformylglycinamidine (FGAM) synthase-like amidotransferase family enzyme
MSKHYEVLVKKSVHFNLTKDSHTALKMACAARGLSMQEVIEAFAKRIEIEDSKMVKFLDEVVEQKKQKANKNFSSSDIDSIFNMIEDED